MPIGNPVTLTSNVASKTISATATASQTLFNVTGGYRINELGVFKNGLRLQDGVDYTARDGLTVTLLSAASGGDKLQFVVFDTFRVAEAIRPAVDEQTIRGNLNVAGILSCTDLEGPVSLNITSGIQTFHDVRVGGALTVAGTLTYEDTTNSNVTGIATFSGGMNISGVGATSTTLNVTGVSTFAGAIDANGSLDVDGHTELDDVNVSGVSTFQSHVHLGDNVIAKFGTGNDLQIYHDGSNSYIQDGGTGHLVIRGEDIFIANTANNKTAAGFDVDGSVDLYHNGTKKFETGPAGTITVGVGTFDGLSLGDNEKALFGAGDDLQLYHSGSSSYIYNATGTLFTLTDTFEVKGSNGNETHLKTVDNGAVELYHNNSKKFETIGAGATVTGEMHATTFHGDGSQLTGVAAAGSGSGDLDITSCLFI
jgi:hypothetical protein